MYRSRAASSVREAVHRRWFGMAGGGSEHHFQTDCCAAERPVWSVGGGASGSDGGGVKEKCKKNSHACGPAELCGVIMALAGGARGSGGAGRTFATV